MHVFSFYLQYVNAQDYHCIWYGQCNLDPLGRYQNCLYDGPAQVLKDEGRVLLRKMCPHFFDNKGIVFNFNMIHYSYKHNSDRMIQRFVKPLNFEVSMRLSL